jgi:hypothetical protein
MCLSVFSVSVRIFRFYVPVRSYLLPVEDVFLGCLSLTVCPLRCVPYGVFPYGVLINHSRNSIAYHLECPNYLGRFRPRMICADKREWPDWQLNRGLSPIFGDFRFKSMSASISALFSSFGINEFSVKS